MRNKNRNQQRNAGWNYQRLESKNMLATIVVNTLLDSATATELDGFVSLREAVEAANRDQAFGDAPAGSGADEIVFAPSLQGRELILAGLPILIRSAMSIEGEINVNANRQSRHFRIATPEEVSLSDLTLFNGKAERGGSLEIVRGNVFLDDVTFRNNESAATGGAIFHGNGQLIIDGGLFERNRTTTSSGNGGAIHSDSASLEITRTSFKSNSAARALGGSVHLFYGNASIEDSKFLHAFDAPTPHAARAGGFIANFNATVSVHNSTFDAGRARTAGGAIMNQGTMDITSSRFANNVAMIGEQLVGIEKGGAIYSTGGLTISDTSNGRKLSFENNMSAQGGAIFARGSMSSIDPAMSSSPSSFRSNTALLGGALRLVRGTFQVNNHFWVDNDARRGGAISVSEGDLSLVNPIFTRNGSALPDYEFATQRGGAIDSIDSNIKVIVRKARDVILNGNAALVAGGAVALSGGSFEVDSNSPINILRFHGPSGRIAQRGGAIFADGATLNLPSTRFENHVADNAGGALYLHNSTANIVDSSLIGSGSNDFAGAIFATAGSEVSVTATEFQNSYAKNGGAIRVNSGSALTVENSEFIHSNLNAETRGVVRGGAIHNLGELNISDSRFIQNGPSRQLFNETIVLGGAIFNSGSLTIDSTSFHSNTASQGGAIYSTTPLTISDSKFEFNETEGNGEAPTYGGALLLNADADVSDTKFVANIANNGGAIAAFDGQLIGRDLTFGGVVEELGNIAEVLDGESEAGFGGAILIANTATAQLSNSTFENNSASRLGGAIAVFNNGIPGPSLTVDEGSQFFRNNTARHDVAALFSRGGAIGTYNASIRLRDTLFEENSANGDGGAIFLGLAAESEFHIVDFDSNQSEKRGGAIFNAGNMTLEDSTVARNTALLDGGLSESITAFSAIQRTEFIDNVPA